MKKLLAMVLALVMTLSLAVSANAFKDDKSISDDYAEAVAVLNGMGVFKGYEDGSFQPKGDITRAEVSAIVYRVYTQDVKDAKASMYATYNKFSDMAGAGWAQGYIGYCANAELVKGYPDGTFKPSGKVTGYEVLAMILRAVGYDKNGEFSGADWALHVAQTAQQAGVLKNVKGVDLNAPASRELVAELLFRAVAESATVTYTPAFGYVTDKVLKNGETTLGYKNFKLVGTADADSFGRPATKWIYNVGDKSTLVVAKADASYTTKVDECDIAKDLGITSSKKIEKAYIDGVSETVTKAIVTTDRNGKIDPKATTSLVGAQGRLTEVYDMGSDGYRLVEINTYLAQVTKVTAAKTDRNGHTTAATVNLDIFNSKTTSSPLKITGVEAEGFVKDQYVLVTISEPGNTVKQEVQSVEAATVTAGGVMKNWTPAYGTTAATTTLADTKYNDADKFYLGNESDKSASSYTWDAITDSYGNLIGLVKADANYLVIEKIEWKHDNAVVGGGKALANVVLADGTKVTGAEIDTVNGYPTSNIGDTTGSVTEGYAKVSDDYTNNLENYNNRIYTYSVNADGHYDLTVYCDNNHNTAATVFNTGKTSTIVNVTDRKVANNNTLFLVMDKDENGKPLYTYTVYNGIKELPSMTVSEGKLCYVDNGSVFASLVVINDYTLASSKFVAYASAQNGYETGYNTGKYRYTVYVNGSTEPSYVYAKSAGLVTVDGFYEVTKAADGIATIKQVMGAYSDVLGEYYHQDAGTYKVDGKAAKAGNLYWDRGYVYGFEGESLVNYNMNPATGKFTDFYAAYRVDNEAATTYFQITKTIWEDGSSTTTSTEITASEAAALSAEDRIVVAYTTNDAGEKLATYVYVLKTETNGQANPTEEAVPVSINIKAEKSVYLTMNNANTKAGDEYVFTLYMLDNGEYGRVADFTATVHADGNGAWVDLSSVLTQGNTYKAVYGDGAGELTSYRSNFN